MGLKHLSTPRAPSYPALRFTKIPTLIKPRSRYLPGRARTFFNKVESKLKEIKIFVDRKKHKYVDFPSFC